jgi:hypothetical protein
MLGLYSIDVEESFHLLVFLSMPPHPWHVLHTRAVPFYFPLESLPLPSLPPFVALALFAPTVTTPPFVGSLQHSNTYPSRSSLPLACSDDGEDVMIESLYQCGFTIVYRLVH